jgi:hypothetical protein
LKKQLENIKRGAEELKNSKRTKSCVFRGYFLHSLSANSVRENILIVYIIHGFSQLKT